MAQEYDLGSVAGPVGPAGPDGKTGGIGPRGPAGQAEYLRRLHFEQTLAQEQLRADLDYVMLMGGL